MTKKHEDLEAMRLPELQAKFAEVTGEVTGSPDTDTETGTIFRYQDLPASPSDGIGRSSTPAPPAFSCVLFSRGT